ncbi:MAG TPA: hypothetical protein PKJ78_05195 [Candidatus Hydrogenedentes bacterium]|nr:hypothetical protein [Candidatus Hydrogenedentota bacterium]
MLNVIKNCRVWLSPKPGIAAYLTAENLALCQQLIGLNKNQHYPSHHQSLESLHYPGDNHGNGRCSVTPPSAALPDRRPQRGVPAGAEKLRG